MSETTVTVTVTLSLPDWVEEIRPHQQVAVDESLDSFEAGNQVVFLDGPVGSGKTLIAEMIRQHIGGKALYVCSDKSLQAQFARDFPYAKVLMGRANYPTQSNPNATAADCTAHKFTDPCFHCEDGKKACPYEIAKREALAAPLAVTNIQYLLTEANYVGGFSGRDLIIVDEADTLESMLMNFVEYRIPVAYMQLVRMSPPIKGARKKTLIQWLNDFIELFEPLAKAELDLRRKRGMVSCVTNTHRIIAELEKELRLREDSDEEENKGLWLREYGTKDEQFVMKSILVSGFGAKNLWKHAAKWLVMSATLISSDEMADSLGLPYDYDTVVVPMTFPVENRQIILAPIADVTFKEIRDGHAIEDLAFAISAIILKHPKDRILVHTVSYDLTNRLAYQLHRGPYKIRGREIVTYDTGKDRNDALDRFKRTPAAIILAPSMERGIDLPDDLCRVVIIAKVPFPSLGDRQVSARANMGNQGKTWYAVQAIRDVVQMSGRAVRHKDDWCTIYILDIQFARNLYKRWGVLFPSWFKEAVKTREDVRWLLRPKT